MEQEETTNATFAEAILGKGFFEDPLWRRVQALSQSWRIGAFMAVFAGLLFIPYLGAVGMWDPWEVHYGEVARQMIHRGDYVYEYWENGWLFSKPAMTMWLMVLGMKLVGTNAIAFGEPGAAGTAYVVLWVVLAGGFGVASWFLRQRKQPVLATGAFFAALASGVALALSLSRVRAATVGAPTQPEGALSIYTEWGMRLPFAIVSIIAVTLLTIALSRTVSRRAALATGFVLCTMPLYFLLTRQAVTDTPFVSFFICAMACAIIGQLDATTRHRAGWWYASYVFMGAATLAKGPIGVGFPAVILFLYACLSVIPWNGEALRKHVDWLAKYAVVPALGALGAAVVVTLASYLLMRNAYSGVDRDNLLVRKICAGILGFNAALVAFVVLLRRAVPKDADLPALWAQFYKMRLGTGIVVFFAVAFPWYLTLILFEQVGNQEENQLFWYRFFVHDNIQRLLSGVHTTTPGGTFDYFIEQGGFAIFPWVALVPGALALVSRLKVRSQDPADHVGVIAAIWVAFTFTLLGSSETKFHHYVFPILPGMAILIGLFIDKLWQEGIARHALVLLIGLGLLLLVGKDLASNPKNFTDLFVYNYDRPYPYELVNRPISLFNLRQLWWGDLICVLLLAFGGYLSFDAFSDKTKPVFTRAIGLTILGAGAGLFIEVWRRGDVSASLLLGIGIALAAAYPLYEGVMSKPKPNVDHLVTGAAILLVGAALIVNGVRAGSMGVDEIGRRLLQTVNIKQALGFVFVVAAFLLSVAAVLRARTMLFGTFVAFTLGFALWFNWNHWVDLSHHWTQRDLFWKYYRDRKPDEPITAFLMNWRGETFYSKNQVKQIKENPRMAQYAALPGRKWALVEHARLGILRSAVGPDHVVTVQSTPEMNNKFVLVTIE